jgi:pyruvate,water dikinase
MNSSPHVVSFDRLRMTDVDKVGGKNATLGELISELGGEGVRVPSGFATTAQAFRGFLKANRLDQCIASRLETLDVDDVMELAKAGTEIRGWMTDAPLQPELREAIAAAYGAMVMQAGGAFSVAVRSSATAEDLPDTSFAGQQ